MYVFSPLLQWRLGRKGNSGSTIHGVRVCLVCVVRKQSMQESYFSQIPLDAIFLFPLSLCSQPREHGAGFLHLPNRITDAHKHICRYVVEFYSNSRKREGKGGKLALKDISKQLSVTKVELRDNFPIGPRCLWCHVLVYVGVGEKCDVDETPSRKMRERGK
ncbi:uncharacterized protein LY79DRAFT_319629 [Colletotrichum navitas]|uniref:Uncharacterized protein n=1 Tax=Colletotrichum navitas TaxID=681940 RepID=A0AAD8V9D0_9PEZI|nr:uncharacterized protein LY79DRAFT_319629 [Colletotrichum navitas]KAK1597844.1 hypothetical protein LY79DRAFT_319629 [Colletotrichum navitas]